MEYVPFPCQRLVDVDVIYTLYAFHFATGYVFRGEQHPFWELVYVDGGTVDIGADERTYTLMQGDILFHRPGEFHSVWANYAHAPSLVVISFGCQSPAMSFFEKRLLHTLPRHLHLLREILREAREVFHEPLDAHHKTLRLEHPGGMQMITLLLEALLIELLRSAPDAGNRPRHLPAPREESETLSLLADFMRAHPAGNVCFADLCRQAGMGATALKQLFHRHLNTSPMAYYEQIRMGEARRLLRETGANVAQAAEALGFSSPSYFSTRFRRVTGMPPTQYIRAMRGEE